MRWTIRRRLTLLNSLALAVLLGAFAALIYGLLANKVIGSVDGKLLECWRELEHEPRVADDPARLQYLVHEFWEHEQVFCAVYGPDSKLRTQTEELANEAVPAMPVLTSDAPQAHSTSLPILGRQRVLTARMPHAPDGSAVVLMTSLADADRTMAQLRTVLLVAVPVMLMASAVVAYVLAARALAPMTALVREARAISAESLDRRLPVANPHDELGELTGTINDMVARLERSFAEMKRFTADASHELRTPLAIIRGEAEFALGKTRDEEVRQLLGSALEECDRLGRLTDQLLTLARQDAGLRKRLREPVNLADLVANVVETLRPLADAKGLTLATAPQPATAIVSGDPDQLRQVVLNVLDNALKYTAAGSVAVSLTTTETDVRILVQDTGEGIPTDHLPHVFERFYRVDKARSRKQGGAGLGLSIAKSIVEAHGGRIELDSASDQGTACTVTLPRWRIA